MINELAWAGTLASPNDEWIELYNPGPEGVELSDWTLKSSGSEPRIDVQLEGIIPAYGFFLLERSDDTAIADITADAIYTGAMINGGDTLYLIDPYGNIIDSANQGGGDWPAGDANTRASMERRGGTDLPGNWASFSGHGGNGVDAHGNPIRGTPRRPNSMFAPTPTPSPTPSAIPARAVMINELAWAGTHASSSDEWIELYNPGPNTVDLLGWRLTDGGDVQIDLQGLIPGDGYFLLERTDDTTISDTPADQIYTGALKNSGERLRLLDPQGFLVDSANMDGGAWPAGDSETRASMERRPGEDLRKNWKTFTGFHGCGRDVDGAKIPGTPRCPNSLNFPTPAPTWIPGWVLINEVLIRPHYDWNNDGEENTQDEFIEIYNRGPLAVDLDDWMLDDVEDGGSSPFKLPGLTIKVGERFVFFNSMTRITLNDDGDTVRLLAPDGHVVDQISYLKVRAYNLSFGRLPDGSRRLHYGLWPTPYEPNVLYVGPPQKPSIKYSFSCPSGVHREMRLPRLARHPGLVGWIRSLGHIYCRWEVLPEE